MTKKSIKKMALFVVFVYLRSWFKAPLLSSAASNDLELYKSLKNFKKISKKTSESCCTVLKRHTWYLTEELVVFSLFDETLPLATRNKLATKISKAITSEELEIRKPTLPTINEKSKITDFVGPRSRTFFDLLEIDHRFLSTVDWYSSPEYTQAKGSLKNLSPTNDSAERAISLMTQYNNKITKDEESFQEMLQVVEHHRKAFSLKTKKTLKYFY